jgi:hypothetical protein
LPHHNPPHIVNKSNRKTACNGKITQAFSVRMNDIAIDDHVPFPSPSRKATRFEDVYPFKHMQPGESIFIPTSKAKTVTLLSNVSRMNKRDPEKRVFKARFVDEEEGAGTRIWRIS